MAGDLGRPYTCTLMAESLRCSPKLSQLWLLIIVKRWLLIPQNKIKSLKKCSMQSVNKCCLFCQLKHLFYRAPWDQPMMEKQKGFFLTQPGASRIHSWSLPCICSDCFGLRSTGCDIFWGLPSDLFTSMPSRALGTLSPPVASSFSPPGRSIESWFKITW